MSLLLGNPRNSSDWLKMINHRNANILRGDWIPTNIQTSYMLLYCIVLYWRGSHCCPNALRPFQDVLCSPDLGITRTWICRLNFAQMPIFSGLGFFNEPEISDSGPPDSLPEDLCSVFYILKKSIEYSRVWTREPWISRRAVGPEGLPVDTAR